MRDKLFSLFLTIGFTVVACVLLYPTFADYFNEAHTSSLISSCESEVESAGSRFIEEEKAKIIEYNQGIAEQQTWVPFTYQGASLTDGTYESLLDFSDGVMCCIEAPAARIYLPVAHGTKSTQLEYEAGHLYGTSLPFGGSSTHAVIAGHTGLKTAQIFTHLTDMEEGDVFYIHILNEIHVYTVDQIKVVLPEDEDRYLQVEDGRDYITLYTCTPYGINDHRLLIRGVRTYPDIAAGQQESQTVTVDHRTLKARIAMCVIAAIPMAILVTGLVKVLRKKKSGFGQTAC